jgi:hypothetical protein
MFLKELFIITKVWNQPLGTSTKRMDEENNGYVYVCVYIYIHTYMV